MPYNGEQLLCIFLAMYETKPNIDRYRYSKHSYGFMVLLNTDITYIQG